MKYLLLCISVAIMFSGGQSYSQSQSCSTVNGKTICNSEKGPGNVAGSSASAITGNGGSYQDSFAMTGDSNTGRGAASRSQRGYPSNDGFAYNYGPQGPNYGPQVPNYGPQVPNYGPRPSANGFDPFAFAGLQNPFFGFAYAGRR